MHQCQPDASRALYKFAAELDTDELRIGTSRQFQGACNALLASAMDMEFDELPDVSFTLLIAINGTMRALFELGSQPHRFGMRRKQLLALCCGYLSAVASTSRANETSGAHSQD